MNGKRIVEFALDANGTRIGGPTTLIEYRGTGQSTIVGLAAGPDGLYFTELYEDSGANGATGVGARLFRVRYVNQTTGDYDRSNTVDGADFLAWQRNFGSVADLNADGNNSRRVDAADLDVWKSAYGAPAVVATAASALMAPAIAAPETAPAFAALEAESSVSLTPTIGAEAFHLTLAGLSHATRPERGAQDRFASRLAELERHSAFASLSRRLSVAIDDLGNEAATRRERSAAHEHFSLAQQDASEQAFEDWEMSEFSRRLTEF